MADITVCIMSYRYGHLAAQAIESVLNQTLKPKHIVFYDDGAGDCEQALDVYKGLGIESYEISENLGIVGVFNMALDNVKTGKVIFLGADNWLHPRGLEILDSVEPDIATYDCYMVGDWDMSVMAQYEQDGYPVWKTNGTPHGSSLYDVELARKVGGYEASGNKHTEEDSMLFSKMIKAGATVGYVERPLLYYRKHGRNHNA